MLILALVAGEGHGAPAVRVPPPLVSAPTDGGSGRSVALVGGTVLPMDPAHPGDAIVNATVLVQGDRIVAVGPAADVPIPPRSRVLDVRGRYVLPGLVDAHVHVFDDRDLPIFLTYGVTGVVNMSGSALTLDWRDRVARGTLLGPRIWTTGPMIDEADDPLFHTTVEVGSEADAQRVVSEQKEAGYDLVKMHGDLEVGLYDAVVDAADAAGMRVVGHLSERVGLLHAMKRHQVTVEHTEELLLGFFNGRFEARRTPTAIAALTTGGAAVTPTLVSIERIARMLGDDIGALEDDPSNARLPPLERANWGRANNPYRHAARSGDAEWYAESLRFQEGLTRSLDEAHVPLLAGTDSGWVPFLVHGESLHDELSLLVASGVPTDRVLAAATVAPGTLYGGELGPGRIAPWHPADLLVVSGDPRADVANLRHIDTVVVNGRVLDREALDRLAAGVQARTAVEQPLADALARGDVNGALGRAQTLAEKGRIEEPTTRSLAMRLSQYGRPDAADAALLLGGRTFPRSWVARQHAGRALLHEGRVAEGIAELEAAATLDPPAGAKLEIAHELARAKGAAEAG